MATKQTIKPGEKAWWHRPEGSRFPLRVEKVFKTTCWGVVLDGDDVRFDTTKGIPLVEIFPAAGETMSNLSYVTVDSPENSQVLHKTNGPSALDHQYQCLSYKTNSADIPKLSYKTDLERIIDDCRKLDRSDLLELRKLIDERLHELPDEGEEFSVPVNPSREVVKRKVIGSVVYQLEKISCGKERCRRCPHGHGPYWYSYQRRDGRVVSKYIGKELGPVG